MLSRVSGDDADLELLFPRLDTRHCASKASCPDYVKAAEANQDAQLAGLVSTVAFVAGVAVTSLGVVLVLTGPSQGGGAEPTAVELAPSFGRNTAGLAVSGTW
jgi:hypothetical protein